MGLQVSMTAYVMTVYLLAVNKEVSHVMQE